MPHSHAPRIEKLIAADYDELIPFLSRAFAKDTPTWFAEKLPAIYQPTDESMGCHLAVRLDKRIAAIVGVYPLTLQLGPARLRVAGIGGVAVDPDYRRQGLMRLLMHAAVDEIRASGYEVSYLSGQRQRYRYFGWERAGVRYVARLDPVNLRHELSGAEPHGLTLAPVPAGDAATLAAISDLLETKPVRCVRDRATVHHRLACWGAVPYAARDAGGRIVGYCALNTPARVGDVHRAVEIVADSTERHMALCRAIVEHVGGPLDVELTPPVDDATRQVLSIAERWGIQAVGNWQIFDWGRTIEALLAVRATECELATGAVTVEITGAGRYVVSVGTHGPSVGESDGPADITMSPTDAVPVLFGPARPSAYTRITGRAAFLEAWCPLPLSLNRQDEV